MKIRYSLLMLTILAGSILHGFEDKPALNFAQRGIKDVSKGAVGSVGIVPGAVSGFVAGSVGGATLADVSVGSVNFKRGLPAATVGAVVGGYKGGKLGYDALSGGVEYVAVRSFAKYHGVPVKVEIVSQFYDINLSQYGLLLTLADKRSDSNYLNQIIDEIYTKRFGSGWKNKLIVWMREYKDIEGLLLEKNSNNADLKNFIRMVELGAAMANLYFNSKPEVKNITKNAILMYQKLGLL